MSLSTEVIICSYNGEKYIIEQIRSIMAQTVPVDRISIYDDRSSDTTLATIAKFAETLSRQSAAKIHVQLNPVNLGYAENFMAGIQRAQADILFLCDQDDVWHPEKVEHFLAVFSHRDVDLIFSDGILIDAAGLPIDRDTVLGSYGIKKSDIPKFNSAAKAHLSRRNYINGAAMAIRRAAAQSALPLPCKMPHDYWLAIWSSVHNGVYCIDADLYEYRQHSNNVIGMGTSSQLYRWLGILRHPKVPRVRELTIFSGVVDRLERSFTHADSFDTYSNKYAWLKYVADYEHPALVRLWRIACSFVKGDYRRHSSADALFRDLVALGHGTAQR